MHKRGGTVGEEGNKKVYNRFVVHEVLPIKRTSSKIIFTQAI